MPLDQTHTCNTGRFSRVPFLFLLRGSGPGNYGSVSGLGWDFESLKSPRIVLPRTSAAPRPPKTRGSRFLEVPELYSPALLPSPPPPPPPKKKKNAGEYSFRNFQA